jgi:hypothetical protein
MDWRIGLLFPDTGRFRTKKHYRRLLTLSLPHVSEAFFSSVSSFFDHLPSWSVRFFVPFSWAVFGNGVTRHSSVLKFSEEASETYHLP